MDKAIWFDMDGTIADLYGVPEWLHKLRAEDTEPYDTASPMVDMYDLHNLLSSLKDSGFTIGVISWNSKTGSDNYMHAVRTAKRNWLKDKGLADVLDEIHVVKYGTPKHSVAAKSGRRGILIDDDENVRKAWEKAGGLAINPMDTDILDALPELVYEWFD